MKAGKSLLFAMLLLGWCPLAWAQTAESGPANSSGQTSTPPVPEIPNIVIYGHLQESRNNLSPQTGTSAYKIDSNAISSLPQGPDTSFNDVLQQSPGVAQDSFGQVHIRGEHANLQYRLNGILLPEGINGFGQVIDSRIVQSSTLLTGTLPAQYGYRTAGIVDIQTKGGSYENAGEAGIYGGSHGTIEPSLEYGGTQGALNYFVTGSHLTSDLGIESPTSAERPIHDHTEQDKEFGYFSYLLNSDNQLQLIAGSAIGHFEIPNNPGQTPNFALDGAGSFSSSALNEQQFEDNQFATLALQGADGRFDYQFAPYMRYSKLHFQPDPIGDLVFNGVASDVLRTDTAFGLQSDGSYRLNSNHTLRTGFVVQQEEAISTNNSAVFLTDAMGNQVTTAPTTITDNNSKDGQLYGLYLQDEWKLTDKLTLNYGTRFDVVNAYVDESQLSPRIGAVYKWDDATTFHAGYARNFTPPPLELVAPTSIAKFSGTTNAPANIMDSPVKSERTHSFDIGATHQLTNEIKLGVDGYYKIAHDLLDEGQFGQALVFTPFNYQHGHIYGAELTGSYETKTLKAYANLAASRAMGENIVSAQFNFDPGELAYIDSHQVHLDHDQTITGSAGFSYQVLPDTSVDIDSLLGSGLRKGFANTESLPWYSQVDLGVTENLDLFSNKKTNLRFTVVNLFDEVYELRDGSGIGVGAPQFGPRRGFFVGLTQGF